MAEVSRADIEHIKKELDMIRCELDAIRYENAPKRKRKKTAPILQWEETNNALIKFIQVNKRLPINGFDDFETNLAQWLQIVTDLETRDSLSGEQRQTFLYTKGLVDGITLYSYRLLEDELFAQELFTSMEASSESQDHNELLEQLNVSLAEPIAQHMFPDLNVGSNVQCCKIETS